MVGDGHDALLAGAVGTAVERSLGLYTVANDLALAVLAQRGELVNRALEAVERMEPCREVRTAPPQPRSRAG